MNCEETRASLWDLIDGDLPPPAIRGVLAHVRRCAACAGELDRYLRLDDELRALPDAKPPATLAKRVMDALPQRVARRSFFPDLVRVAAAVLIALAAIYGLTTIEMAPVAEIRDAVHERIVAAANDIGHSVASTVDLLWRVQ